MGKQCPECKGHGTKKYPDPTSRGTKKTKRQTCKTCHGKKEI